MSASFHSLFISDAQESQNSDSVASRAMDLAIELEHWALPAAVFAGFIVLGYIVKIVVIHKLEKVFAKTSTDLDDLLLGALRRHIPIWILLAGLAVSAHFAPIKQQQIDLAGRGAVVGFWISLTFAVANLGSAFLSRYASRDDSGMTGSSLTRNILRSVIVAFGALLILQNLGVEITPLLTALGVGSFAIALGLQPTLADLFAGIHITLNRHVRVGDFVILETGLRGRVLDIGWRAVRILDGNDNVVAVPNGKLAGFIVTNTNFPEPSLLTPVECSVAYSANLEKVESIAITVAKEVQAAIPGGVPSFEPLVRFHTFGDNAILFRVVMRSRAIVDQGPLVHAFMKQLKARFDAENIEIPFPQRVVHFTGDRAFPSDRRSASAP